MKIMKVSAYWKSPNHMLQNYLQYVRTYLMNWKFFELQKLPKLDHFCENCS